jgi:hypothetical protein
VTNRTEWAEPSAHPWEDSHRNPVRLMNFNPLNTGTLAPGPVPGGYQPAARIDRPLARVGELTDRFRRCAARVFNSPSFRAFSGLVSVLFIWGYLSYGVSLIPAADPAFAVPGCACLIVLVGLPWARFYVIVWRRGEVEGKWDLTRKGSVLSPAQRIHPSVDALLTVLFVWLATSTVFALLTSLTDNGSLAASAPELSEEGRYNLAATLYLWHLLDFLPVIGATDTLNWDEPAVRYSGTTGALLLLYKTLVLAPGLVVARRAWTNLKDPAGARDASPAHAQPTATHQPRYCAVCDEQRPFVKKPINHVVHMSLSLVTVGLWALCVWLPLALINTLRKPRCNVCGHNGATHDGYCAVCDEQRPFVKKPINPINQVVHWSLSLVTVGLWALFVWLPLALINILRKPRCTVCGHKGRHLARRSHAGHGAPTNDSPPLGHEPPEPAENREQG